MVYYALKQVKRGVVEMSYIEYVELQKAKGIQPLKEVAFNAMIAAGFDFLKGTFS